MGEVTMLQNYQNEHKLASVENTHAKQQDLVEKKASIKGIQDYKQSHLQSMQQR